MTRRVVVTGIGLVTPIGEGLSEFWTNLLAGQSGVGPVTAFDTSRHPVHNGAEIKDFHPERFVTHLSPEHMGRASQFAIAASRLALADGAWSCGAWNCGVSNCGDEHEGDPRMGAIVGTTSGEPHVIESLDDVVLAGAPERIDPRFVWQYPSHMIATHVSAELGCGGVTLTLPVACAAGNAAIAYASDAIRSGEIDRAIAGGVDVFSRITFTGFARLGAIAPERCQPFDRRRKGMIPGEGAAMLLLETLDHAFARGARVYAEIAGYGLSCDAHHMTAGHPTGDGAVRAMQAALASAGLEPGDVSYVSAHGTGTLINDRLETLALKRVFGHGAYGIPISSIKSMLGHTMGAASAIEAAACAMAVATDRVPATMHLEEPDPECDLDYVPNAARSHRVAVAMNNAYAFGGNNSSLLLRKCESTA